MRDFLSFKEETLIIKQGTTSCIMGRNLTEENQESNGSGKSALQTAIEFIYTGNFSRKVVKTKLIRRGCSESFISHVAFNNVTLDYLQIDRILPKKGSEKIEIFLYKNVRDFDKDRSSFKIDIATTPDANKWIEDYIGIDKTDISNYFIPNEVNYTSFFSSPDSKKKELISRFSNADIVDPAFIKISKDIADLNLKIVSKEKELINSEGRLDQLREDLIREQEKGFEAEKNEKIEKINQSITEIKSSNPVLDRKLVEINDKIKELTNNSITEKKSQLTCLNQQLEALNKSSNKFEDQYKEIESEKKQVDESINKAVGVEDEIKEDLRAVNDDISKMNLVLKGKIECPKCKHEFNPTTTVTVEEAKKNLDTYSNELNEIKEDLLNVKELIEAEKNKRASIQSKKSQISAEESKYLKESKEIENSIYTVSREVTSIERNIQTLNQEIKNIEEDKKHNGQRITDLLKKIEDIKTLEEDFTRQNEIKDSIESLKVKIKDFEKEVEELTQKQSAVKEWEVNFKLFKSFLANKKLRIIQDMINTFLIKMKCDYKLKLEGYKQLSSGEIREKITPYIYSKDGEVCEFGEFSKGERARIDFATLLTLQTLVNESCEKGGLSLLFIDEIVEGLDSLGLKLILDSLESIDKTVLMTTHVTNESISPNIIMVEKVNGISKII